MLNSTASEEYCCWRSRFGLRRARSSNLETWGSIWPWQIVARWDESEVQTSRICFEFCEKQISKIHFENPKLRIEARGRCELRFDISELRNVILEISLLLSYSNLKVCYVGIGSKKKSMVYEIYEHFFMVWDICCYSISIDLHAPSNKWKDEKEEANSNLFSEDSSHEVQPSKTQM